MKRSISGMRQGRSNTPERKIATIMASTPPRPERRRATAITPGGAAGRSAGEALLFMGRCIEQMKNSCKGKMRPPG